jgi:hypothetical protein
MLNQAEVLRYVKDNMAFPFHTIEWDDEKILQYTDDNTRKEFSYYIPQAQQIMPLNTTLAANKVPGVQNKFYMTEPCGLEIYNVVEVYFSGSEYYVYGHPPLGPMSQGEVADWAFAVESSMTTKQFGTFDYTFEFTHPNILRISPVTSGDVGTVLVEYEREQPSDLSGIPNDLHMDYKKLALADVMIAVGRIRKRYGGGNLRTPFGEIPLESDIHDEGKEIKRDLIEKLERLYIPNIHFDHG